MVILIVTSFFDGFKMNTRLACNIIHILELEEEISLSCNSKRG
jgi:hypothetical protein